MIINNKFVLKKYNTGIIIQARTGSKRFPKKILNKINNKTILEFMIDRLLNYFNKEDIYVATTNNKKDKIISDIVKKKKINLFRGSEKNVILRFIKCAEKYKLKNIIRLTSDCPLIDPQLIIKYFKLHIKKKYDYSGNCFPYENRTYPVGSDFEFFKNIFLKKIYKKKLSLYEKEHITPYIKNRKFNTFLFKGNKDYSRLRFTLDFREDLVILRRIISYLQKRKIFGHNHEVVNFLIKNKKLVKLNNKHVISYYQKKVNQL